MLVCVNRNFSEYLSFLPWLDPTNVFRRAWGWGKSFCWWLLDSGELFGFLSHFRVSPLLNSWSLLFLLWSLSHCSSNPFSLDSSTLGFQCHLPAYWAFLRLSLVCPLFLEHLVVSTPLIKPHRYVTLIMSDITIRKVSFWKLGWQHVTYPVDQYFSHFFSSPVDEASSCKCSSPIKSKF